MSAAVSATGTDPSRRISSRYQVGLGQPEFSHGAMGQDAAGIQAGLFEQILSLPVPIETDFQGSSDDWAARANAPQETHAKSENEGGEESHPEEPASSEDNEELAASVAAVDQAVPLVGLDEEPTAEDAELALQVQEEGESEAVLKVPSGDLKEDGQGEADAAQHAGEQNDALTVDEATGDAEVEEDLAANTGTKLFDDSLDSEAARQVENDENESATGGEVENLVEDDLALAEIDGNEKVDEAVDADTQTDISESESVSEDRGNRRDSRDRKEKWFEKDASEQAEAREAARAGEDRQPVSIEEHAANAKDPETQEFQQPIAAEAAKLADEATESAAQNTVQNVEALSPSLAAARETILPAGFTTTDSDAADRGPQNISGLGRATEKPGAPHAASGNKPTTPGESADLTQQERVRLVQRVARSFARIGPEGGQINLRLHPPQLGSLNVQVRLEGRSMTANLTTENGAAREAILESLPVLRSRLAEQGFEISQFQVDVASNGSDASQGDGHNPTLEQGPRDRDSQLDYRRPTRADSRLHDSEQPMASNDEQSLVWQTHTGIDLHA